MHVASAFSPLPILGPCFKVVHKHVMHRVGTGDRCASSEPPNPTLIMRKHRRGIFYTTTGLDPEKIVKVMETKAWNLMTQGN